MNAPSPYNAANRTCLGGQQGLSLVELMVSITIALLVLLALSTVFLNFHRTQREMAKSNAMIENGRIAIQLLENDVVHGGFRGTYAPQFDNLVLNGTPGDVPDAAPDVCLPFADWNSQYKTNLIGIPVQTFTSSPASCKAVVANQKSQTDLMVVRHAENCTPGESNCEAEVAGRLYFQAAQNATNINATGAIDYVLDSTGHTLQNRSGTAVAPKRRFISNIYYVRTFASSASDGIPTLMRSSFDLSAGALAHQTAVPIVEGIEGFKVYLGIDNRSKTNEAVDYTKEIEWSDASTMTTPKNRGDGTPDEYCAASACTPAQLTNAVAARIFVLARNIEPTPGHTDSKTYQLGDTTMGPFNDNYKRHVYSTTVRLVNVSARRETP